MKLKRLLDIVGAMILLILFVPVFLVISIVLIISQKGSIIYVQERIGKNGIPFRIYKFRTMKIDSEMDGVPRLTNHEDKRLTPIGRFLRNHHLDELPQLWNVVLGDMSFVGPRPERQFYIDRIQDYNPRYSELLQIQPGLTSYATLHNGYTDTIDKMLIRLDMDLYYLEHQSLWLDTKIIIETIYRVIIGEGKNG